MEHNMETHTYVLIVDIVGIFIPDSKSWLFGSTYFAVRQGECPTSCHMTRILLVVVVSFLVFNDGVYKLEIMVFRKYGWSI